MAAIATPYTGKAIVQDSAVKVSIDHFLDIRPEKTVLLRKTIIIDLLKRLKMVFNALVILRSLRFSRAVYRRDIGHWLISPGMGQQHI